MSSQILYINDYLFFRRLEKVFEEKRNAHKKKKRRGVTTNYNLQQKGDRKVKDRDNEILGFDFDYLVA